MDIVNCLNLFFNKLFKNRLSFILIIFSFFLLNPLDSHALDIYFYGNNYANLGKCSDLNWCVPNDTNSANIIAIRIEDKNYQIIADSKYKANQTFKIWNKANNFTIRDDVVFYAGAIRPNTITYNAKNSSSYDEFGETYIVNYGVANEFTAVAASTGYFYEYYFPSPMQISRFEIAQWDIINTGSTTGDIINNSTNTIINNNNTNTDKIINTQKELNDFILNDDEVDRSEVDNFFSGINSMIEETNPVSDLLLMPITLLNAYNNGISSSCSPINLGNLLGTDLIMPCIDIERYLGSNLFSLIDILFSIFLFYEIGMLCVSIFESITTLDDGFQLLYSPKHGDLSRVGRGHSRGLY